MDSLWLLTTGVPPHVVSPHILSNLSPIGLWPSFIISCFLFHLLLGKSFTIQGERIVLIYQDIHYFAALAFETKIYSLYVCFIIFSPWHQVSQNLPPLRRKKNQGKKIPNICLAFSHSFFLSSIILQPHWHVLAFLNVPFPWDSAPSNIMFSFFRLLPPFIFFLLLFFLFYFFSLPLKADSSPSSPICNAIPLNMSLWSQNPKWIMMSLVLKYSFK